MENITTGKKVILGFQHVLAMFGATVLVPILTGLDPAIALLAAGIGTLLFHAVTKGMVPVFLGSSFAFIPAIAVTLSNQGLASVKGGLIIAGIIYVIMGGIIKLFGVETVKSFFPPIVTGPIIMVIGLRLSPIAITDAMYERLGDGGVLFRPDFLLVSSIVVLSMIVISIFAKGFFKLVPILISVIIGYIVAYGMGFVNTSAIVEAPWISLLDEAFVSQILTLPSFNWTGIIAIAPIALVVFIEHIGDITTNGAVVGKDFFKNPGIHRTMLGDGIATITAGLLGGPANTTYSENTGVLAVTKVYDPSVIRLAAIFAIFLSFIGKFGAIVRTIPTPVMGGVSIILFGMIASVGVRILINAELDFAHSRNLIISALILVLGIGIADIPLVNDLQISGLAIAALAGVIFNKVLPKEI
ncbi:uracil permease [Natranaerovirga pectinivora]|uniref:Uracil permease n=1 Tax=Natranaerovirga pectinivora TaxID=682400 RepID=A0A4R3MLP0_9FIRM|nr:uracil-xanthine permease family protein [Natranaerovirga pectinivora]TCT14946.1 uracil permease [Natranaerovirga pectinivora]